LLTIRFRIKVKFIEVLTFFVVLALVGGFWFIIQILNGNYDTVVEFIVYQIRLFQTKDAGHGGFLGYHFVILLFGVFPSSIIALKSFRRENLQKPRYALLKKWMIILFWVVLILFTIVKTKIVHYSSLAYFPITFLAANFIYNSISKKYTWSNWQTAITIFITLLLALPVITLQFIDKYKDEIIAKNWIHDDFAVGNLQANGNWSGLEFLIGAFLFISVLIIFISTKKHEVVKRATGLLSTTLIYTVFVMLFIVPRVEKYSQNALVEFYKSKATEDVYLKNIYFKSYATWFYGNTQKPDNDKYYDENWLLTGNIDKDVYFVTKIHRAENLNQYFDIEKIEEKNGFVFFKRKAK